MKQLILIFIITFSTQIFATKTLQKISPQKKEFLVSSKNQNLYEVLYIVEQEGSLQELVEKRTFTKQSLMKKYLRKYVGFSAQVKKSAATSSLLRENNQNYTEVIDDHLWKDTNAWSPEWEERYANWIEENIEADFFKKYNIATDCADVIYFLRWIFARTYSLPVANRLEGSDRFFSNLSLKREWLNLPTAKEWHKDQRFLAALRYLAKHTSTRSLTKDSYPRAINKDSIQAGVFFLLNKNHSRIVQRKKFVQVISSTVPKKVRVLKSMTFYDIQPQTGRGFRQFRWPSFSKQEGSWFLTEAQQMPHYSDQQYDKDFIGEHGTFSNAVMFKTQSGVSNIIKTTMNSYFSNISQSIKERDEVVKEGYHFCLSNDCSPGTENYENWSTPSRDQRLIDLIEDLLMTYQTYRKISSKIVGDIWRERLQEVIPINNKALTLKEHLVLFSQNNFSSDPRDEIDQRWHHQHLVNFNNREIEKAQIGKVLSYSNDLGNYKVLLQIEKTSKVLIKTFNDSEDKCTDNTYIYLYRINSNNKPALVARDSNSGVNLCSQIIQELEPGNYILDLSGQYKVKAQYKIISM